MTSPSQRSLAHDGADARKECLLHDLCVGDFVLPVDMVKIAAASEMQVV